MYVSTYRYKQLFGRYRGVAMDGKEKRYLIFSGEINKVGDWYLAACPQIPLATQGKSRAEAKDNMLNMLRLYFETLGESGAYTDGITAHKPELKYAEDDDVSPKFEALIPV